MGRIEQLLASAFAEGRQIMGQVAVAARGSGEFLLTHRDDVGRADLAVFTAATAAREIATYDDLGQYRPLKSAPNLKHGWALLLPDVAAVRCALDFFYPAGLALWLAQREGRLAPTSLRETLNRQTGMYRVTARLTGAEAEKLVGDCCAPTKCLRTVLWAMEPAGARAATLPATKFEADYDQHGARVLPLLCAELCNLVVAEARVMVKGAPAPHGGG